ncbi:hypothetical protein OOZ54_13185 [Rhodopseudomonas palustris]|uniref:hypothetical protein n=1 Tax=Rhodopseudomonas palustris TaxID=1076 RepID=UPI0022F01F85|nr:hypothetical protein [Rhodopseudomonas palustris]WBU27619.1 hypothetical protein OOZ54_13185 [Rhodopseudomonas palustris]
MRKISMLEQMRLARAERERSLQSKVGALRTRLSDEQTLNLKLLGDLEAMGILVTAEIGKSVVQFARDSVAAEYEPILRQVLQAEAPVQVMIDPGPIRAAREPISAILEAIARQIDQHARASIETVGSGESEIRVLRISLPAVTIKESIVEVVPAG